MSKRILVTGANGFVGRAVCRLLSEKGYMVCAAVRSTEALASLPEGIEFFVVGEIGPDTDWSKALNGVDAIIHLAGLAHVARDNSLDSFHEYHKINTLGTEHLARMAVKFGVQRLIFLSSIKVNGEYTLKDADGKMQCFSESTQPSPGDYYAISKWEAEQALRKIEEAGLEVVILRSPLIYGPGVKANFLSLLKLVDLGIPLPLASLKNSRSFLYLGNLVDIILKCLTDPKAAGQTFLVSDGQALSTPGLIKKIAKAMGRKPLLLPFPISLLKFLGRLSNKYAEIEKLTHSLCINNEKIVKTLNWEPPYTLEEGIRDTVDSYKLK